jgi:hypothetical protein
MRMILHALLAVAATIAAARTADAGPVKHWAALPDREIRTIALRGDMSSEPIMNVVPGADGWIYVRGKNGLYRLLGTDGTYVRAASFAWCDDRQAHTVVHFPTPAFACVAKNVIVEQTSRSQYRRVLPLPAWTDPADAYVYDYPFVTSIERGDGGRWWFSYGYAGGLGYSDPDGRTRLVHLLGLPPIRDMARLGDDILLAADGCVLARVRNLRVAGRTRTCEGLIAPRFVRAGDSVWVVSAAGAIERRDAGGRARRFDLGVSVGDVAYDRVAGITYLLGAENSGRNVLVTLTANDVPHTARLPMTGGSSIAVDRRGRIWISVPFQHSLVAIASKGA